MTELRLDGFLPFRLNRLASEVSRALEAVYGERFGINVAEWRVLATLGDPARGPGRTPIRAQDIVASTRMHKSMVSRAVATLAGRGWLTRDAKATDRREAMLGLTDAGRQVYRAIVPAVLAYERELLAVLDPAEIRAFKAVLSRLEQRLDLSGRGRSSVPVGLACGKVPPVLDQ